MLLIDLIVKLYVINTYENNNYFTILDGLNSSNSSIGGITNYQQLTSLNYYTAPKEVICKFNVKLHVISQNVLCLITYYDNILCQFTFTFSVQCNAAKVNALAVFKNTLLCHKNTDEKID